MRGTPDDMHAAWNERYANEGFVFGVEANQFVVEHLSGLPPGRALDLACGQGRNAVWLALRGHRVTAVDFSDVAIEQGRRLAEEADVDVDFVVADLMEWEPVAGAFDLVLLSYLQLPDGMRQRAHGKAVGALAPHGKLFLIAHHADNLAHGIGGPQTPEVLFDEEQLAEDFAALDIARNERVLRHVVKDDAEGDAVDILLVAHGPSG